MFSVGDVLATTFRVALRSLPRWLVLALIFHLPVGAWYALHYFERTNAWITEHYYVRLHEVHPVLVGYTASGMWIVYAFSHAAITIAVVAKLRGEHPRLGTALGGTVRRAPAVFVAALFIQLVTVGLLTLVIVLVWNRYQWVERGYGTYAIWLAAWCVLMAPLLAIGPAVVIERRGPLSAIRRGFALGRGNYFKLLALCVFWQLLFAAVQLGLWHLLVPPPTLADFDTHVARRELYYWIMIGVELVYAILGAVHEAVVFERLREAREGPPEAQLDRVFE